MGLKIRKSQGLWKGDGEGKYQKELWLGPLSLNTKALECLGHTLAGPVGLSCTKLIMRILTSIFRLLSCIWKMKMPSKSDYFFPARFRHFHHGRGYQLKARGLLVEKKENKRVDWFSARVTEPLKPLMPSLVHERGLPCWQAHQPTSPCVVEIASLDEMLFKVSGTHQISPLRPLLVCINHLSDVYDFDLSSYDHLSKTGDHF